MNATSKKVIPPILLALGVELDHMYGSKWLNDELYKLGFAVSYREITKYKQACSDEQIKLLCPDESFTHFIADNVDHNVCTLIRWSWNFPWDGNNRINCQHKR